MQNNLGLFSNEFSMDKESAAAPSPSPPPPQSPPSLNKLSSLNFNLLAVPKTGEEEAKYLKKVFSKSNSEEIAANGVDLKVKNFETLSEAGKDILNRINTKRTQDEIVHAEFKTCFETWSSEVVNKVIENLYDNYENFSTVISEKFSLISDDLERIRKLEKEISSISNKVETLYKLIKD